MTNVWFASVLLLIVAAIVRCIGLTELPLTDELYTMLAARGWLHGDAPAIAGGVYERAELFTIIDAAFLKAFGENLVVGRLPSVVAGSLLVVAVFLWTRQVASNLAAWMAALFVCFSPLLIFISQFARFYALLALVFWLGAIGVYALAEKRLTWPSALAVAIGSFLCLALALHLQILTLMGLAGIGGWLAGALGVPWLDAQRGRPGRLWFLALLAAVVLILIVAIVLYTGIAQELIARYRFAPIWNRAHRNEVWFYHVLLTTRYQTLWPLFPLLALLACARRPAPTAFCFTVFAVIFVLLSFGGMKDRRYITFALPFLFVIWSIALAEALPFLVRLVSTATERGLRALDPRLDKRAVRRGLIGAAVVFLFAANGASVQSLAKLAGVTLSAEGGGAAAADGPRRADWASVKPNLEPFLQSASVVLTTHDVQTLYYLGRADVVVNNNRISELNDAPDFTIDPRTGRPVVSEPGSMQLLMSCFPDGLIVGDAAQWRTNEAADDAVADVVERGAERIDLPDRSRIVAFHWHHPAPAQRPAACASLPPIPGAGA